jgi:hypothetical protein
MWGLKGAVVKTSVFTAPILRCVINSVGCLKYKNEIIFLSCHVFFLFCFIETRYVGVHVLTVHLAASPVPA